MNVSTFNGLPAHILLVHFIVVLAPLVAILEIVAALWAGARRRLVWLIAVLAVITLIMTPITTSAGEWLEKRTEQSALLRNHTELGDTMLYFSIGLVVVALLLALVQWRERRSRSFKPAVSVLVAVIAVVVGVGSTIQVYRIGDSGARATWSDVPLTTPDSLGGEGS